MDFADFEALDMMHEIFAGIHRSRVIQNFPQVIGPSDVGVTRDAYHASQRVPQ
jgi:hypothetical protein